MPPHTGGVVRTQYDQLRLQTITQHPGDGLNAAVTTARRAQYIYEKSRPGYKHGEEIRDAPVPVIGLRTKVPLGLIYFCSRSTSGRVLPFGGPSLRRRVLHCLHFLENSFYERKGCIVVPDTVNR